MCDVGRNRHFRPAKKQKRMRAIRLDPQHVRLQRHRAFGCGKRAVGPVGEQCVPGHIAQSGCRRGARLFALGFFRRLGPLLRDSERLAIAAFVVKGGGAVLKGLDFRPAQTLGGGRGQRTGENQYQRQKKRTRYCLPHRQHPPDSNRGEIYLLCWVKVRRRGSVQPVSLADTVEPAGGASSVREFRCWWRETSQCDVRNGSLWPKAEIEMPSEPVRVAEDLAEVFTSATPATRDVILVGGMVGNRPCFLVAK